MRKTPSTADLVKPGTTTDSSATPNKDDDESYLAAGDDFRAAWKRKLREREEQARSDGNQIQSQYDGYCPECQHDTTFHWATCVHVGCQKRLPRRQEGRCCKCNNTKFFYGICASVECAHPRCLSCIEEELSYGTP